MPSSPVFFTNRDPRSFTNSELDVLPRVRLIIVEVQQDNICRAYVRSRVDSAFEQSNPRWAEFGPLSIHFISSNKNRSTIKFSEAYDVIKRNMGDNASIEAHSKLLGFSFVTMAQSAKTYRELIDQLRGQEAIEILLSINDLVSLREFRPNSTEIKNHALRKRIIKSIATTTEQLFLLDSGINILRENERAAIDDARPEFQCEFRLHDGREYSYDFKFGQTSDLGRRICVLIGKNGSGKSQTLRHVAKMAFESVRGRWLGNFHPSRIVAFYSGARVSRIFPAQTLNRQISGYKVFNISHEKGVSSSNLMVTLLDLIKSGERIADITRFGILVESLLEARRKNPVSIFHQTHGPVDVLKMRTSQKDAKRILFEIGYGREVEEELSDFVDSIDQTKGVFTIRPNDFSSGEEAYVRFCIFSAAHTENGSLLLLDEPEVFLHPQFIDALMGSLHRILELTGSTAIVATHSAYVVRCVQEDMVYIINSEFRQRVDLQKPRMKTFGADVGIISLFVFGEDEMETTRKRAIRYAKEKGRDGISIEATLRAIASEDLVSLIVNNDEKNR